MLANNTQDTEDFTGSSAYNALVCSRAVQASEREISLAVANVVAFGTLSMLTLPTIAHILLGGNSTAAGMLLGVGVHDTAQVCWMLLHILESH